MAKRKYLYCLIKEREPKKFNILGIEKKKVYTINEGIFGAVVSDSEIKEYPISRENTLTHQKVIEAVMKKYDVLPFGFGMVAPSNQDLKKTLSSKTEEVEREFEKIRGKIELNLKALWESMPVIFQEIAESSPEIQRAKRMKISRVGVIEVGKLVGQLLERKKEKEAQEILKPLGEIASDFKENKIFGDDMILNTAFLVARDKEKEFDERVNDLGEKYRKKIKFIYVGPLPPCNFIHLCF